MLGVQGLLVDVEAHVTSALPGFTVGGLGDATIGQASGRIKAAGSAVNIPISLQRVTVNLSPASVNKGGSGYDLGMFVAIAAAMGKVPDAIVRDVVHLGELGLDGAVKSVPGVLPCVRAAALAGARHVVVPAENAAEARLVSGIAVHPVADVGELVARYASLGRGQTVVDPFSDAGNGARPQNGQSAASKDLSEVLGQSEAKLALQIAAVGGHHLLMAGPPGAGKTMLAERLPGILPPLDDEAAMEVTAIHSVLGALDSPGGAMALIRRPPFVAPHHGASPAALIGGGAGRAIRPGAITAAHHGVLFLDETPEFAKDVLQALRTPLERGTVTVARAAQTLTFPARFQLILAANPCPCGMGWGRGLHCTCSPNARRAYFGRLSGPLLDRVDLQVHVQPPGLSLASAEPGPSSASVAETVLVARAAQRERWSALVGEQVRLNADVPGSVLREPRWRPGKDALAGLDRALDTAAISLRGYDRCLRVAWSVADLQGHGSPTRDEIDLALSMRRQNGVAA